jgi:hypothetical protein
MRLLSASLTQAISLPPPTFFLFDFTITRGMIFGIELVGDPDHLRQLDLAILKD